MAGLKVRVILDVVGGACIVAQEKRIDILERNMERILSDHERIIK